MDSPREAVALAMGTASAVNVQPLKADGAGTTFRVSFDMHLDADMVSIISRVAKRHDRSLGAELYTFVRDVLKKWRPPKPRPPFVPHVDVDGIAKKIAGRYGE